MVQLVLRASPKLVGACSLSSLVLGIDGWVQGNSSLVLPLTRHQGSIYCKIICMAHSSSKQKWVPQTTLDILKGVQKLSINKTEHFFMGHGENNLYRFQNELCMTAQIKCATPVCEVRMTEYSICV